MKMFKKLFAVLVLGFMSVLFLTACDGKMQDGVYRAFKESLHDGAPQVTIVTVTVKDGKITDYDIDTIQSKADESRDPVILSMKNRKRTWLSLRDAQV
jgi:major membrane immunogen (membrane-anchored lipoprotein)